MFVVEFRWIELMDLSIFNCMDLIARWGAFYTKILEVNLFAIAYRLFHEDFSPIDGMLHDTQPY